MRHIHSKLFHTRSPFAYACICAYIVGISSSLAIATDIVWLLGDYLHNPLPHHVYILIGLTIALVLCVGSFYYFYRSINRYLKRHAKILKQKREYEEDFVRNNPPTHCNRHRKRRKPYEYFETYD